MNGCGAYGWSPSILRPVSELDAVVNEHGKDAIRNCFDERRGGSQVCSLDELNHSDL